MGKIAWDLIREYEVGCNKVVLFQNDGGEYTNGVAWNGVTSISTKIEGGEVTPLYSGNRRVRNTMAPVEYGVSLKCYCYPEEFEGCIGEEEVTQGMVVDQQEREIFGLSYQTKNGTNYDPDAGYTIHLLYGCTVSSYDYEHSTINSNLDAVEFSFEIDTIPENYEGLNALAHIKVKSLSADPDKLAELENILYGTDEEEPRMPRPEEVYEILVPEAENNGYPDENLYPSETENPIET